MTVAHRRRPLADIFLPLFSQLGLVISVPLIQGLTQVAWTEFLLPVDLCYWRRRLRNEGCRRSRFAENALEMRAEEHAHLIPRLLGQSGVSRHVGLVQKLVGVYLDMIG